MPPPGKHAKAGRWFDALLLSLLVVAFAIVTRRMAGLFFSGDDLMNMHAAWSADFGELLRAQFIPWLPVYRPLGQLIHRLIYANYDFNPVPLYLLHWLLQVLNVVVAYRFCRVLGLPLPAALVALSVTVLHGAYRELYTNAGTIFDQLWFLFAALAVMQYARMRRDGWRWWAGLAVTGALCMLAMNSKEGAITIPVVLLAYECIYVAPGLWWRDRKNGRTSDAKSGRRTWLVRALTAFVVLGALSAAFYFGRVQRTLDFFDNPAYRPEFSFIHWLDRVASYLGMEVYQAVDFTPLATALVLAATLLAAVWLRNRCMLFGWVFFVLSITPVALIGLKSGYVLYVPNLGLSLYCGALFDAVMARVGWKFHTARAGAAAAVIISIVLYVHWANWRQMFPTGKSAQEILTAYLSREYPTLPRGSRILLASDHFDKETFDAIFNVRLFYGDRSIVTHRVEGASEGQRPPADQPWRYNHVFTTQEWDYAELDNRDIERSIRLRILANASVGRDADFSRRDHRAYVVSGVLDHSGADAGRWIAPQARLKFDLYPADASLRLQFRVPDAETSIAARTLSVRVNGKNAGSLDIRKAGLYEPLISVPKSQVSAGDFTLVDLSVDPPYANHGQYLGVVLLRAAFEYAHSGR